MATKRKRKTAQKRTTQHAGGGWVRGFLAALSRNGNVTKSAELVKKSRSFVYSWRAEHPDFAAKWNEAIAESTDRLEHEARRRAQFGTNKPVWYKGSLIGFEQEFSDTLMLAMLKAKKPNEYGDKLTIRITPQQAALFKEAGIDPDQAWNEWVAMFEEQRHADADNHPTE